MRQVPDHGQGRGGNRLRIVEQCRAGGIQVHKSLNNGTSWTYLGNATEDGEAADRQWMAASAPGHLIVTWMGSETDLDGDNQTRAVVVNTTFDSGTTWTTPAPST